jgi:hypothetical protein
MSPCISALMVPPRLRLERLGIAGMGSDEFPTTTDRVDHAVFQEQNRVSLADRRKAVRDEQHRWPSGSPVKPVQGTAEKALLAPLVEGGRRFIVPEALNAVRVEPEQAHLHHELGEHRDGRASPDSPPRLSLAGLCASGDEQAVEPEQDQGSDQRHHKTRTLSWAIKSHCPPEPAAEQRTHNA